MIMKIIWRMILIMLGICFRIGIFGKTKERAFDAFDKIIEKMGQGRIKYLRRNSYEAECMLVDGTAIRAVSATDNARGYKFDKIIYDEEIDIEKMNYIVRPCLLPAMLSFSAEGLDLQ